MMGTPFRDSVVVSTWPYLGAALTSSVDDDAGTPTGEQEAASRPHNDTGHEDDVVVAHPRNTLVNMGAVLVTQNRSDAPTAHHSTQWGANMRALLAYQVWTRSAGRMETKADLVAAANSSVGRRCLLWNAYSDSLIPCPARVVMPDDTVTHACGTP